MKRRLLLVITAPLMWASCSYQPVDKEAPAVNALHVSEQFRINLPEDHTKGYTWLLANGYDAAVINYRNAVWHSNDKGVDFNFKASGAGKTELVFYSVMYHDTAATKRYIIEVK
jgi:predicted secreted protein